MAISWFRWFRGLRKKEAVIDSSAEESLPVEPVLTPREELLQAALRDAAVIHGANRDWMRAELVSLSKADEAGWDVRLVVSVSEMDVWDRAEAFQTTFLEQLNILGEDLMDVPPAITWKFMSQETGIARKRRAVPVKGCAPAPLIETKQPTGGGGVLAGSVAVSRHEPGAGRGRLLEGELVV